MMTSVLMIKTRDASEIWNLTRFHLDSGSDSTIWDICPKLILNPNLKKNLVCPELIIQWPNRSEMLILSCFVQSLKTIGQMKRMLWTNEISRDLS